MENWQEKLKTNMEDLKKYLEDNLPSKTIDSDKKIIELVPFFQLPFLDNKNRNTYNCYLTAFSKDLQKIIGRTYPCRQIMEIAYSYFHNKSSILESYNILSTYSVSVKNEFEDNGFLKINNCSILLKNIVVSIKTAVDSICVFLQLLENDNVDYHCYTDVASYCEMRNSIKKGRNPLLISKIEEIKKASWFKEICEIRNQVIHRGFTLESWLQSEYTSERVFFKMVQHRLCIPRHFDSDRNHIVFESFDNRCHFKKIDLNPIMKGFLELEFLEKELVEILIEQGLSKGVLYPKADKIDCARNMNF